jgi:hypothetical protein
MPRDPVLRAAMAALAESSLRGPVDVWDALSVLTEGALEVLPKWACASISVHGPSGGLQTLVASDDRAGKCDELQGELMEGPCFDAVAEEAFLFCGDLERETRWPRYVPQALELGVRAQMATELAPAQVLRASLTLYATHPVEIDDDMLEMTRWFASSAAGTLGLVRKVDQLEQAVQTRQQIGTAVGIVMERYQVDANRAFGFLTRLSQDTNRKLRLVAAEIVQGLDSRARNPDAPERSLSVRRGSNR